MIRRPPEMNLPEAAMPWGRWLTEGALGLSDTFADIALNTNSVGSNMQAQLSNVSQNIETLSKKRVMYGQGNDIDTSVSEPSGLSSATRDLSFAVPSGVARTAMVNVQYSQPTLVTQPSGRFLATWLVVRVNGGQGINFERPAEAPLVFNATYPFNETYASVSAPMAIAPGAVNVVSVEFWSFVTSTPGFPTTIVFKAANIEAYLTLEEERR